MIPGAAGFVNPLTTGRRQWAMLRFADARQRGYVVSMAHSVPLVSIVVPSFQQGRFLRRTLDSLVQQSYPRLEVIVWDNLSGDETPGILEEYGPKLSRVVREKDEGQSDALRRGFELARGEVLGWLNSDDMLMPDAVASAVAALEASARPDVVYAHCAQVDEQGQFRGYYHDIRPVSASSLFNQGTFICQPGCFFRKELYLRAGGVDPKLDFALDWDLWCRMARAGGRFRLVEDVWAAARVHPRAKSAIGGRRRLAEIWSVNRKYKTTWLPRAALGYVYGDYVRKRLAGLDRAMGALWELWTGDAIGATVVEGLGPGNVLVGSRCRVRFPYFRSVKGAQLRVWGTAAGGGALNCRARLNNIPGKPGAADLAAVRWRFETPRMFSAVELDLDKLEAASPRAQYRLVEFVVEPAE